MKKQYIQPNISSSQMVCIQSIMGVSKGINTSKATFTAGNSDNIEIGTKERNEWGNIGGDDMTYGSIW
ncbi:MAG: hypothetical protein J6T52_04900 [Bacteroidaceae bacterium]|jgi:hypothetical protein|nr:hypothetical protein [Bacteroidaceae bacterium]